MKILVVADKELTELWDNWSSIGRRRLEGVELILSAGDLSPWYLEFLVSMLNVPCLYVRGNHDSGYDEMPPGGCIDVGGRICEIGLPDAGTEASGAGVRRIRIAGLGGSMRYRQGTDMYTEDEMKKCVRRLRRRMRRGQLIRENGRTYLSRELASSYRRRSDRTEADPVIDILLTHAPCRGYGDLEDLPHQGFECFNRLLNDLKPRYHLYGHVHMEYGRIPKEPEHPSGTHLINVCGMHILEI